MDFELTADQQLMSDSLARLLHDQYDFEARKRYLEQGWSPAVWAQFAELGLLGATFAEADGGLGGGAAEQLLIMEALGRHLTLEPYLASVVLAGGCLRRIADSAQRSALIGDIIAGTRRAALAHSERKARFNLAEVTTTARRSAGGWILNGAKHYVLHGGLADTLLVSARIAGGPRDRSGIGLFRVDCATSGITRRGYRIQDGSNAADIRLEEVGVAEAGLLADAGQAFDIIEKAVGDGIAALCAEAVGVMGGALEITVEYMKARRQFGVLIGSFQALQHRAVDMLVMVEQARSMAMYAAVMDCGVEPRERQRALSASKVQIGRAAKFVGEQAIQLHGGIGMTEECQVGHYYRRLSMIEILFGDSHHHLAALGHEA